MGENSNTQQSGLFELYWLISLHFHSLQKKFWVLFEKSNFLKNVIVWGNFSKKNPNFYSHGVKVGKNEK